MYHVTVELFVIPKVLLDLPVPIYILKETCMKLNLSSFFFSDLSFFTFTIIGSNESSSNRIVLLRNMVLSENLIILLS